MTALRRFSIEPDTKAQRSLFTLLLAIAAVLFVCVFIEIGWRAFIFSPSLALLGAFAIWRQRIKDIKLTETAHLRDTVAALRSLHEMSFDDACKRLEDIGNIISSTRVRLSDPRTWFHPQRRVEFECWPFSGTLTEKFSRVALVSVMIDDDKES